MRCTPWQGHEAPRTGQAPAGRVFSPGALGEAPWPELMSRLPSRASHAPPDGTAPILRSSSQTQSHLVDRDTLTRDRPGHRPPPPAVSSARKTSFPPARPASLGAHPVAPRPPRPVAAQRSGQTCTPRSLTGPFNSEGQFSNHTQPPRHPRPGIATGISSSDRPPSEGRRGTRPQASGASVCAPRLPSNEEPTRDHSGKRSMGRGQG